MVGPIMAPRISPANEPASGVSAIAFARGYPPISLAKRVVANMAGSAPRNVYTGTTTTPRTLASTGAMETTPSMAIDSEPIAMKPSSNFSPNPYLLPNILSRAPRTIKNIMIYRIISLIPTCSTSYRFDFNAAIACGKNEPGYFSPVRLRFNLSFFGIDSRT